MDGPEELQQGVRPDLPLVRGADVSQHLHGVHHGQHRPLEVRPAEGDTPPGQRRRQPPDLRQPLGQDVLADHLQPLEAPQRGQLLVRDEEGAAVPARDLQAGQQGLGRRGSKVRMGQMDEGQGTCLRTQLQG